MAKRHLKNIALFLVLILSQLLVSAQERIPMTLEKSGIYTIPCEINGLKLHFVFDTGASEVHISLLEAAFMLKNGYITENDFIGTGNYLMADGSIAENALINLKSIKIGNTIIKNVTACVSSNINASLLFGQSAIKKIGRYAVDGNYLILYNSTGGSNNNSTLDYQYQLWLALSDVYETGTFEEFKEYLSNDLYRGKLYLEIVEKYDLPDYATFSAQLGYNILKNEIDRSQYKLWVALSEEYEMGTFEVFKKDITDEYKRRKLYNAIYDDYDLPDYETFSADLGFKNSPKNLSRQKDIHYYLAQVSAQVNLREGPGTNYKIISKIPKGSYVLLSSSDVGQSFRKVLYIDDNVYGYVSKNYLTNQKIIEEDKSGTLTVESRTYKSTADIKIENKTNKNTTINIGDISYSFKPYQIRTIKDIKPGKYKIMASAPGVIPYVVIDDVEAGYEYSWVFYITTIRY